MALGAGGADDVLAARCTRHSPPPPQCWSMPGTAAGSPFPRSPLSGYATCADSPTTWALFDAVMEAAKAGDNAAAQAAIRQAIAVRVARLWWGVAAAACECSCPRAARLTHIGRANGAARHTNMGRARAELSAAF